MKDVLGLVPGASLAQWIGARLAATSLTIAARLFTGGKKSPRPPSAHGVASASEDLCDLPAVWEKDPPGTSSVTQAATYDSYSNNTLGLEAMATPR
jgi:hypothetical protein